MIVTALAPASASQPPAVTRVMRSADASRSTTTTSRVALDDALSRLGRSIATSCSAIVRRPYNLATARVLVGWAAAGVVELADTPGLGPGDREVLGVRVPPPALLTR